MKNEFQQIVRAINRITSLLFLRHKIKLLCALLLMILAGAITNVPPVILGKLVDNFNSKSDVIFSIAIKYLIIILVLVLIKESVNVLRRYLVEDTCTKIEKRTRIGIISHLLKLDFNYFSNKRSGAIHGRFNRSLEGFIRLIKLFFLDFFPSAFTAIFAIAITTYKAPLLGIIMFVFIPSSFFIIFHQIKSQKGIRINLLRGKEEIDGTVVELLGGLETVRAMNSESFEENKVETISEKLRKIEIKHHIWMAGYDATKSLIEGIFYILVIGFSLYLASRNIITIGEILTYSILFNGVIAPMREIHRIIDEAHESSLRVQDLSDLLNTPIDSSFQNFKRIKSIHNNGNSIIIKNLDFRYSESNRLIINNLNLSIRQGEFLGICGPTGCGKSTFIKILLRLLHPQNGEIYIHGQEIKSLSRNEISKLIGYVSQRPFLSSGTVFENIIYGTDNVSFSEVIDGAKKANIHDEITSMPAGYETKIGEYGNKISGGQRQRIALARVFLRNPSILIFDEATSSLDNINEENIQKQIEEIFDGKTIIAIAHRLTTLRNTDRIIVMNKGKIIEEGEYWKLVESDSYFAELSKASISNSIKLINIAA